MMLWLMSLAWLCLPALSIALTLVLIKAGKKITRRLNEIPRRVFE